MFKDTAINTNFREEMTRLALEFNELTLAAERCRRDNNGKRTVKEAEYYDQASKVCDQILKLTTSERAVQNKWQLRRMQCLSMMKQIADAITANPPASPKPPVPAETPSGFVTRNACEDVSAETIESWYRAAPRMTLDDICGMEQLKARLKNILLAETDPPGWKEEALKQNPVKRYFFYGLPGTGKTAVIHAFIHELMEKGFRFIQLTGGDIYSAFVGVAEKTVKIAFREAMDKEPCVLFIDDIEDVCLDRAMPNIAGHRACLTVAFLQSLSELLESHKRVILITASNHPELVDGAYLRRTQAIRVDLPDAADRAAFFTRKLAQVHLEAGLTAQDMADATEHYSYRDLNRLWEDAIFAMKDALIAECQVFDENGSYDAEATDRAAIHLLERGQFPLTRAMFDRALARYPIGDKTAMLEQLRAFEEH